MLTNGEKLGAFIVPTGIGAAVGGFAGDASGVAREFSRRSKLIVNPNVVNAGCFSGVNENMLYVEGYSLDAFFRGEINLQPAQNNKISVIFDKSIPQDVLNIHINTINAVKTVYGIDVIGYEITDDPVGINFEPLTPNPSPHGRGEKVSAGSVENIETLIEASRRALQIPTGTFVPKDRTERAQRSGSVSEGQTSRSGANTGADALALVCFFEDIDDPAYAAGLGVDPIGGVEAIISHCISKELKVPCAHSPAFADYQIHPNVVDPRAAAEYITPTFLPCVLLGLQNAPLIESEKRRVESGISIDNLDYLVMPAGALGSTPVFEALRRGIKVFAVKENFCALNVNAAALSLEEVIEVATYNDVLRFLDDVT